MSGLAMLIGIEKPMPVASRAIAVLMPMTAADGVEQRAAAVAGVDRGVGLDQVRRAARCRRSWIGRPMADTMPLVTVFVNVPSGLPIATTSWPTLSASESPIAPPAGRSRRS